MPLAVRAPVDAFCLLRDLTTRINMWHLTVSWPIVIRQSKEFIKGHPAADNPDPEPWPAPDQYLTSPWPSTSCFWLEDGWKVTLQQQQEVELLAPIKRSHRDVCSVCLCVALLSVLKALQPTVCFACFALCRLAVLCMFLLTVHMIQCVKLCSHRWWDKMIILAPKCVTKIIVSNYQIRSSCSDEHWPQSFV